LLSFSTKVGKMDSAIWYQFVNTVLNKIHEHFY